MNFIVWCVIGALIGGAATVVMKADGDQNLFLNVVVGGVGAMLSGWAMSSLIGARAINQSDFDLGALLDSSAGAVVLLGAVNMLRRGWVR